VSDVRIGVAGLGVMGRNHARVLRSIEGVEFVGVYDPECSEDYDGVPALPSFEALLDEGLDGCVVAAPTSEHYRLASLAAECGVAALVEKPLSDDVGRARDLLAMFHDGGILAMVGHIERFNAAAIELERRLKSGQLGELYQISTRRQGPFPERIRDVGVVMDLATHDIDLTRWVTAAEYHSLSAWTAHKSGRAHEDLVVVAGRMTSGLVVSHHVNWLSTAKERLTMVTGEGGTLVADTLNVDLYFHENSVANVDWPAMAVFRGVGEGDVTRYALDRREPLRAELEAFCGAIRDGSESPVPLEAGVESVRVAEKVVEAAASGECVRFDVDAESRL
jgi:UDP-N-acetylglucosamine 3-dehydrogenase